MTAAWMTRVLQLARTGLLLTAAPLALAACTDGGPTPADLRAPESDQPLPMDMPSNEPLAEVQGGLEGEPAPPEKGPTCRTPEVQARITQLLAQKASETETVRVDRLRLDQDSNRMGSDADQAQRAQDVRVDTFELDRAETDLGVTTDALAKLTALPPCVTETPSYATTPPTERGGNSITPMSLGTLPVEGASAGATYGHSFPSAGDGTDSLGVGGQALIGGSSYGLVGGPKGSGNPWYEGNLEVQGGWGESFTGSSRTALGQITGAYLMNVGPVRFGPVVGYQGATTGDFTNHTTVYGGYGEAFPTDQLGFFARGGGFQMAPGGGGFYVGGGARWNPCPRLTLTGSGDYSRWNTTGGYYQTQVTAQVEYQPWTRTPLSLSAGYTYAQSGYADFPDYHPASNEVFVGVRVWISPPAVMTLEDDQRNGPVIGLAPNF